MNAPSLILLTIITLTFPLLALSLDEHYAIQHTQGKEDTQQVLQYFWHGGTMPEAFNEQEAQHLTDVKHVLWGIAIIFLLSIIGLFFLPITPSLLRTTGIVVLVLLCLSAIIPFNTLFTLMHHVFFPQGNWMFPATSTLIQYYPYTFWLLYGKMLGILILKLCSTLLILGVLLDTSNQSRQKL